MVNSGGCSEPLGMGAGEQGGGWAGGVCHLLAVTAWSFSRWASVCNRGQPGKAVTLRGAKCPRSKQMSNNSRFKCRWHLVQIWAEEGKGQMGTGLSFPTKDAHAMPGALQEEFKYPSAKNYMDKLFKEEPGPRDMICGFALYHVLVWRAWKKGLFRMAASGQEFVSTFSFSMSCFDLNQKGSWHVSSYTGLKDFAREMQVWWSPSLPPSHCSKADEKGPVSPCPLHFGGIEDPEMY